MSKATGPRGCYGKIPESIASVGDRVRAVRVSWRWTLKQLGAAIHYTDRAVSNWEQGTQRPGDPALGVVADLFGLTKEALQTGVGFRIPEPPRQMGGLLVADNYATDMVVLPIHGPGEIALVNKETGTYETVSLTRMAQVAREAREEERPVWIVIGKPRSKPKRKRSDKKAT